MVEGIVEAEKGQLVAEWPFKYSNFDGWYTTPFDRSCVSCMVQPQRSDSQPPPWIICQGFHRSQRWQCLKEEWTIGIGTCPNTIIVVRYLIRNRERRHFATLTNISQCLSICHWPGCIEWITTSRKRGMVVVQQFLRGASRFKRTLNSGRSPLFPQHPRHQGRDSLVHVLSQ